MKKEDLHAVVKMAAHNAYAMRKQAAARRSYIKATVKTAAAGALRKQDLKGALLARVNGEKTAAKVNVAPVLNRIGAYTGSRSDATAQALSGSARA